MEAPRLEVIFGVEFPVVRWLACMTTVEHDIKCHPTAHFKEVRLDCFFSTVSDGVVVRRETHYGLDPCVRPAGETKGITPLSRS